jgi:antagonist of KipI
VSIRVIKPGLLSSVQDRGRHGYAALGVGHAGAMDRPALCLANALVGNDANNATLEFTLIGPVLHFDTDARIALCGADVNARLDETVLPMWQAINLSAGAVLDCSRMRSGARAYLAVAGGIRAPRVLDSLSTDINSGLGGRALVANDVLSTGTPSLAPTSASTATRRWGLDPRPWFDPDPSQPIHLIRGTHFAALTIASQQRLYTTEFRIANDSNRVGFRLEADTLNLETPLDVISEPVNAGTMQLPPSGQPIVLMAEHPTTGGYPRIGQVAAIDLPRLAQRRPGDRVRFVEMTLADAQSRYLARQRELANLITAIHERLQR